jgi:hypothetical protein
VISVYLGAYKTVPNELAAVLEIAIDKFKSTDCQKKFVAALRLEMQIAFVSLILCWRLSVLNHLLSEPGHPNVLQFRDYCNDDDTMSLLLEYAQKGQVFTQTSHCRGLGSYRARKVSA